MVTICLADNVVSVNVALEDMVVQPQEQDPRHTAFYEMWEYLLGIPDSAVAELEESRRAVFLIGLFEAEVINGGLGQYLANTEGAHLIEHFNAWPRSELKEHAPYCSRQARWGLKPSLMLQHGIPSLKTSRNSMINFWNRVRILLV